jgi:hypothetical protein
VATALEIEGMAVMTRPYSTVSKRQEKLISHLSATESARNAIPNDRVIFLVLYRLFGLLLLELLGIWEEIPHVQN